LAANDFVLGFGIAFLLTVVTHTVEGTVVSVNGVPAVTEGPAEPGAPFLLINTGHQFQTFDVRRRARIERESRFDGERPATARIALTGLTPGEFVRLDVDPSNRVTRARAIARVERARVRSAGGDSVVLEDGRTLTISTILRYVDGRGKPSARVTVRPGDTVLLFHHLQTGNVYRFAPATGRLASHHSQPPM